MTKFILTPSDVLLNMDYVEKIGVERPVPAYIGEHFIAAYTKDGRVWKLSQGYRERDREELHTLLSEFGVLLTSHPAGVFTFNAEYLVHQKNTRETVAPTEEPKKKKRKSKKSCSSETTNENP
jgi:hypothetical protein